MQKLVSLFAALALVSGVAYAQQYKWVDKNGKTQYGDAPPAGVKAIPLKGPATPPAPPPAAKKDDKGGDASKDAKSAKKGPLTPAEQEAEFRKRQIEAAKASDESAKKQQEVSSKKESCETARDTLRTLESGSRISRTNASGERFFIDDNQRAAETAKAQKSVADFCG